MQILIFTDDNGFLGFARYAGAYRIATELRSAGYSVQVVDFFSSYSIEQIKKIIDLYIDKDSLFIGFATSLWVNNWETDFIKYIANSYEAHLKSLFPHDDIYMSQLFEFAKAKNSDIKFVVGGSKAESFGSKNIDYWVIGQGETAVLDLALKLKNKEFSKINPIIEGKKLPYDDFSNSTINWADNDYIFSKECLPIEIARGCIFRCSFCYYPLNGKKKNDYIKSKEHLKKEILNAHLKFGTETFLFTDDLINDSLEKVEMLYALSQELPFKSEWSGFCRLDMIYRYPQMADLLYKAGIRSIYFGIETLHPVAGAKSGKGLGPTKTIETLIMLKKLWNNKVLISGGFIVGLPGEPISSVEKTLNWLLEDDCPIDVADVGVLNIKSREDIKNIDIYNSRIGMNPEDFGLRVTPDYWEHNDMNSTEAYKLVYNFYSNPKFLKKKRSAPLTMYPRLKNLGYSFEDIYNITLEDLTFKSEAKIRRENLFKEYSLKILNPIASK